MSPPSISVIIATCNRRPILERVLHAYEAQQEVDGSFEVIVVDDGSTDGTSDLLASWHPERYAWWYAAQKHGGPGRARNLALRRASGAVVLFTGDDILPAPALIARHLEAHRTSRNPFAAFVGYSGWPADIELTSTMRHVTGVGAQQFSYHYFKAGAEYDFRHFYTSNFSIRRSVLDLEPTLFSTAFPKAAFEDIELSYRLSLHGMRIYYLEAARAEHHHYFDVRRFFARQMACGEMGAILCSKFPELRKWVRTGELEGAHLLEQNGSRVERRRTGRVARELAVLEARLINLGGYFDRFYLPPLDALLAAVFDYAYLKGLAMALGSGADVDLLCAFLFRTRVVTVVTRFAEHLAALGVPIPASDFRVISAHAA